MIPNIARTLAAALASAGLSASAAFAGEGPGCRDDAMLVFDASGSMAGLDIGGTRTPRIFEARSALRRILPQVTKHRNLGLIIYGPGRKDRCSNIDLRLMPRQHSAPQIIAEVDNVLPDGNTPLTDAVQLAAEKLRYRERPGEIVLVTDGLENCGGETCELAAHLGAHVGTIKVHVIGFKVRTRSQFSQHATGIISTETTARCLAEDTGGKYVSTESVDELVRALKDTLGCPIMSSNERELPGFN